MTQEKLNKCKACGHTETEYRKSHRAWCEDCQSEPKPDDHCDGCAMHHIKAGYDGTVFAAPSGYRPAKFQV